MSAQVPVKIHLNENEMIFAIFRLSLKQNQHGFFASNDKIMCVVCVYWTIGWTNVTASAKYNEGESHYGIHWAMCN
jgi:hypothetical protein